MVDRESRKKQITEQRQKQILGAAGDIFTLKGYAAATIPEIAELAGVAVGTVYNYYSNKRDLFIAAIKNLIITASLLDIHRTEALRLGFEAFPQSSFVLPSFLFEQ